MFKAWFFIVLSAMNLAVFFTVLARHPVLWRWAKLQKVSLHLWSARLSLALVSVLVAMVEGRALMYGHAHVGWLVRVHWVFAVPCALGLGLLNFRLNGRKSRTHILYACLTIIALIGTDITGIPMANMRF